MLRGGTVSATYSEVPPTVTDPDAYLRERERHLHLMSSIITASDLQRQTFAPLRFAVPGVLPEGYTVLAGKPKVGKSWLMLSLAVAVASGGHALGHVKVDPRPVLYLALEDSDRRLQLRINQLLQGDPAPEGLRLATTVKRGDILDTIRAYLEAVPNAGLIVLDVLAKVSRPTSYGESPYERDYAVGEMLHAITQKHQGLALVAVHHVRKAESVDFVDSSSGTNGITGAADTYVVLARDRHEQTGLLSITSRDMDEKAYAMRKDESGAWLLTGGSLDAAATAATQARADIVASQLGDVMRRVVDYVRTTGSATPSDIEQKLAVPNARVILSRAVEAGLLDRASRGHYIPVTSVTTLQTNVTSNSCNTYLLADNDE